MNRFIKRGLPFVLASNLLLLNLCNTPVFADSDTEINGTVQASTIDVSASGTATYTINGKTLTSDTIGILNNSNFPISLGISKVEKTIGTLADVLPQTVGNKQDWFNLGKTDSNSKIALGLKHIGGTYLEENEPDTLYFKQVQDAGKTITLGSVAAKGNLDYEIDGFFGLAFNSDVSEQYKITWDISLYQDFTYTDNETDSIYVYSLTDYSSEENGITGTAIIQALKTGGSAEMIVPELYETSSGDLYKVIGIGNGVFAGRSVIQKITLPNTIESIGQGAFQTCSALKQINIPESCNSIGGSAFYNCNSLETIYLPDGLSLTGSNTFNSCTGLTKIKLPEGMTTLPATTFGSCSSLKMVTLPSTLETVEDTAFTDCRNLESLDIPASVTAFNDTLAQCTNFKALYVHTQELKDTLDLKEEYKNANIKIILE